MATTKQPTLRQLLSRKAKAEESLAREQARTNALWENTGWGSGMRKSRISFSCSKEDRLKERIREYDAQIAELKQKIS